MTPGNGWSSRANETASERAWRQHGYRDGYAGRPKKWAHPIYLRHYAIGASAWTREQNAELEAWEAAHRG